MIEYTLEKTDLAFSQKAACMYAGKKMKNRYPIRFFYFLFMISAVYSLSMVIYGYRNWPPGVLEDFNWLVASLFVAALSIYAIYKLGAISRFELLSRGHTFPIEVQIEVNDEGLEVRSEKSSTWLSWGQIDGYHDNDSYFILYSYASNSIAIPKDKVRNQDQLGEFMNSAKARFKKLL